MLKKPLLLLALTTTVFAFSPRPASATLFVLERANVGSGLSGFEGPYGSVEVVALDANTARITLMGLTQPPPGSFYFLFGDGASLALNLNLTADTQLAPPLYDGSTAVQPQVCGGAGCQDPVFKVGSGEVSEWGQFNFVLANEDGFKNAFTGLTLTLTKTGGPNWLESGVLVPNDREQLVAAHFFPADSSGNAVKTCGSGGDDSCTGFAVVPDGGATVALLGLALAGIGLVARRMK